MARHGDLEIDAQHAVRQTAAAQHARSGGRQVAGLALLAIVAVAVAPASCSSSATGDSDGGGGSGGSGGGNGGGSDVDFGVPPLAGDGGMVTYSCSNEIHVSPNGS